VGPVGSGDFLRDRQPAVTAKRDARDSGAESSLPAFPFGAPDHCDNVPNEATLESASHNLWLIETFDDEEVEDLIQHLIIGQAVLVGLAWS
jgi:hypothetical protein